MKHCAIAAVPRAIFAVGAGSSSAGDFTFKRDFLRRLVEAVPALLKSQDPQTGRFGKGIWVCTDQNAIFPLAAAWATRSDDNPYYHEPKLLEAIMSGGDVLIEAADKDGKWRFDKKDGSFWGMIHMPWTYSRWVRAFGLIRDAMPPERRERWENALALGYGNIAKTQLGHVHNIPTHHAMGLYFAGQLLDKPEWCKQAREFMAKVVAAQDAGGFWSEHCGPVVQYDFVYVEALGIYHAVSGDQTVLPAPERAARFHAAFTYPDGSCVETIDERNPYSKGVRLGNVGFTFSPEGRSHVAQQLALLDERKQAISADDLASFILYGQEGPTAPTPANEGDRRFVLDENKALVWRKGPWFVCLSAYVCEVPSNRWQQDLQNLVSILHDKTGLIVGGGNTKLQPLWSTFTVGDISLLKHKPGDEDPKFTPDGPLWHVASEASLTQSDPVGLKLKYGEEDCEVYVEPADDIKLNIRLRSTVTPGQHVEAHLTLLPHLDRLLKTERAGDKDLNKERFSLTAEEAGQWVSHAGWRISLPAESRVVWPVLPHNPYVKDGSATLGEGRIVICLPFAKDRRDYVVRIEIPAS